MKNFRLMTISSLIGSYSRILAVATLVAINSAQASFTASTNLVTYGNTVTLSWQVLGWPSNYTGWTLQSQTSPASAGLSTNWVAVSGSTLTNRIAPAVNPAHGSVFFRLKSP